LARRSAAHVDDRAISPGSLRACSVEFELDGRPKINFVLCGRGKKNWKTSDLILAALYRFLVWLGDKGNDCFILANEEGQAADDLSLAKNLIAVNPILAAEVVINDKEIARRDGKRKR
jgi:hypothetical protein